MPFCVWLIPFSMMSSRFIHAVACAKVPFMFSVWTIFQVMHTPHAVYAVIFQDTWGPPTCGLLCIVQLWTLLYKHLFTLLLSVLLNIHPEVEFLGHVVTLVPVFKGLAMVFSTVTVLYYIVSNSAQDLTFTYILTNTSYFCLLIIAILMGKKWYLIVSFTCIEHSSLCLLAIFISS